MIKHGIARVLIAFVLLPLASTVWAGQPLETETARLLKSGKFKFEGTFEYQTSSEGTETVLPMLIEYGISQRFEIAVEPVLRSNISPKVGRHVGGLGDMEATLTYLVGHETPGRPAIALAFEIKFPTAKDPLLGTKKTDYTGYIIASRRFGNVDVHGNVGYAILGRPTGVQLRNIFSFAVATEFHINPEWDLVGEVFANTVAAPGLEEGGTGGGQNSQTAELAGGEIFGMVGGRWHVNPGLSFALGVVYDNNNALLIRPGITLLF